MLILRGDTLRHELREIVLRFPPQRRSAPFLLANLAAFGVFLAVTRRVFAAGPDVDVSLAWFAAWLAAALAVGATALPIALPVPALRALVPRVAPAVLVGLLAGVVTFGFGRASEALWPYLSDVTLAGVAWVLSLFTEDIALDAPAYVIGTGGFLVEIAPVCSGVEGIGLISVFLSGYLLLYRSELRFPHVLAVLPIGIAFVWLLNLVRLAALIGVGAHISEAVALGGFHSTAGWLLFCAVALGLVAWVRAAPVFARQGARAEPLPPTALPVAPFLMPLLAWIAMALVTGLFTSGFDLGYPARLVVGGAVLWAYRDVLRDVLRGSTWSWEAAGIGVAVFALWWLLVPAHTEAGEALRRDALGLGAAGGPLWIAARVLGSVLFIPIAEELAFRGYLMRRLIDRDFGAVPPNSFSVWAVAGSSLAFALIHASWLAGALAGLAFAMAQLRHGRIGDAILAHAVANALIAAHVLLLGGWGFWA